jgi:hypothetical protein
MECSAHGATERSRYRLSCTGGATSSLDAYSAISSGGEFFTRLLRAFTLLPPLFIVSAEAFRQRPDAHNCSTRRNAGEAAHRKGLIKEIRPVNGAKTTPASRRYPPHSALAGLPCRNGGPGGLLPGTMVAIQGATGTIHSGLRYPIVIAAAGFVICLFFVKKRPEANLST